MTYNHSLFALNSLTTKVASEMINAYSVFEVSLPGKIVRETTYASNDPYYGYLMVSGNILKFHQDQLK